MSRHRTAVVAAVEDLSQAASGTFFEQAVASMRKLGTSEIVLNLFPAKHASGEFPDEHLKQIAARWLVLLEDVQEGDVSVSVRFSAREAVCVVADRATKRHRMIVADATVK